MTFTEVKGLITGLALPSDSGGYYWVRDDHGQKWFCPAYEIVPLDGDKERKTDMDAKMTTYEYEVIVSETWVDGKEIRARQVIARSKEPSLEAPTREDLLMQYAKEIAAVGAKASEVVVNIVPFAR